MRPSITRPHRISNRRRPLRPSIRKGIEIGALDVWGPEGSGDVQVTWEYLDGGQTYRQVLRLPVDRAEELITELREQIAASKGETK